MERILLLTLLFLITLTVPAGELFQFDQFSWNLFDAKKIGNLVSVEKTPMDGTERQLTTIHWSSPHPNAIILISKTPKTIQDFDKAELILTVHASQVIPIKRMILRLKDASGKIFPPPQSKYEALHPGKNEIHYILDTADPLKSAKIVWKAQSNNENLEKPLLLYSIGVDLDAKTPDNQQIRFDSLEILPKIGNP